MQWFGGGKTASGAIVSNYTALNFSALWACVRVICKPIAAMPIHLYEKIPSGGKQRAVKHPIYSVIHTSPNPEMTPLAFKDTLTAHVLTWGNAYAEIERNKAGYPIALWPLSPNRVTPERNKITKELQYGVNLPDGGSAVLRADQVFHIPGPGFDGIKGYSVLTMFRESIGLGVALQEYAARFFGNGAIPGGVLEHPGSLGKPAQDNLRASWNEMHSGLEKTHRISILEEGMKYQQIGVPPEDAQMLESRKFSQVEMASIFQVPPHKIGNLDKATFTNIEHQAQEFLSDTLLYWLTLWEQTICWKLLTPADRARYFAEFLTANLLRGDIKSRYEAYAIARQWGWYSADDIREKENENPLPDGQGKGYLIPMNMTFADQVGQEVTNSLDIGGEKE
jgi:HK97 family phage portal protein